MPSKSLLHTSSGTGTTQFVKMPPELEAVFIVAALHLGTRPRRYRDSKQRAAHRKAIARYFGGIAADTLPPLESWPARLHGRMSDNYGEPLPIFEKLAVAYMWWIDEHFRQGGVLHGRSPADGKTKGAG